MRKLLPTPVLLIISLLCQAGSGSGEQTVEAGLTITSPPTAHISEPAKLLRRDNGSCSYGACAGVCLSQGAFCCNPGGTRVSPKWICDNGSCITSVRGDSGIVDCYDPDNPSGTTQSCIDYRPTAKCASSDRCYTCESTKPYCHWQTWIASHSPTLRWFSCATHKLADATYLAATITGSILPYTSGTSSSTTSPTSSTSLPFSTSSTSSSAVPLTAASATPVSTIASATASAGVILGTGAITGIAVGGGLLFITCIALAWCIFRRRKADAANTTPLVQPMLPVELASPMHYESSSPGSVYNSDQWRWHSAEGGTGTPPYLPAQPQELPVQAGEAKQILRFRSAESLTIPR